MYFFLQDFAADLLSSSKRFIELQKHEPLMATGRIPRRLRHTRADIGITDRLPQISYFYPSYRSKQGNVAATARTEPERLAKLFGGAQMYVVGLNRGGGHHISQASAEAAV
jgi:hypothetical protein